MSLAHGGHRHVATSAKISQAGRGVSLGGNKAQKGQQGYGQIGQTGAVADAISAYLWPPSTTRLQFQFQLQFPSRRFSAKFGRSWLSRSWLAGAAGAHYYENVRAARKQQNYYNKQTFKLTN